MEFDGIDNLSEEEIFQLYIDVVDSDESYILSAQTCTIYKSNGWCDKWCENPTAHYYYNYNCK